MHIMALRTFWKYTYPQPRETGLVDMHKFALHFKEHSPYLPALIDANKIVANGVHGTVAAVVDAVVEAVLGSQARGALADHVVWREAHVAALHHCDIL